MFKQYVNGKFTMWLLVASVVLLPGCAGCPGENDVGREVPPGQRQEAVPTEVTPQGQIAFISGSSLHIINADGSGEKRLGAASYAWRGQGPVWSPDGERIAFLGQGGGLYVINIDDLEKTQLVTGAWLVNVWPRLFQWLPDGQRLLFEREGGHAPPGGIWSINKDGTGLVQVISGYIDGLMLSPDGTRIAYFIWLGGDHRISNWALATANIGGTDEVIIFEFGGRSRNEWDETISWSPDGQKVTFAFAGSTWVINSDGTNPILIDERGDGPTWTPDGRILFTRLAIPLHKYIVNCDGTGREVFISNLYRTTFPTVWPSWSPCERWFALQRGESIYIYQANGTQLKKLAFGIDPQWSPRTP